MNLFLLQPHDHANKVAKFYYADAGLVSKAIDASLQAKKEWDRVSEDFSDGNALNIQGSIIVLGPPARSHGSVPARGRHYGVKEEG